MPFAMSSDQIDDFLQRNPSARQAVMTHNALLAVFTWEQITRGSYWDNAQGWIGIDVDPIPAEGLRYSDSKFGEVVIFPDAKGTLRFTAKVAPQVIVGVRANPSATANLPLPSLPSFPQVQIGLVTILAIGIVGYLIVRKVMP